MNIMLTDLPLLTSEAQEIPAVVDSGAQSFAGMFHQQFPEAATTAAITGSQAIEFKEFFENIPLQAEASSVTLETFSMPVENQPSAQITNPTASILTILPDHVDNMASDTPGPASGVVASAGVPAGVGELLPVGGSQLPQKTSIDTPVSGSIENSVKLSMTSTVTPPAITPADVEAKQDPSSPTVLPQPAAAPPSEIKPDQGNPVTTTANAITAKATGSMDVVAQKEKAASPESILAVAREIPVRAKAVTENGPSEVESIRRMVAAAEVLPSRPEIALRLTSQLPVAPVMTGHEFKLEQLPETASRMAGNAKQVTAADNLSAREVPVDGQLLRGDNMLAGEPVPAREVSGNIELRGLEMPAPAAANTTHQALVTAASNMHAAPVSTTANLVPATEQNPLPPQLASMSLTRNADSIEWGNGLSERVNWMINQKQNSATIRLDPPMLGKLDVQIKIVDDTTTITIQTQTGQTRDLIEAASIRLRDMLQESGYQNVNVDVSQRHDQQQARAQTTTNTNPEQDDASDEQQASDQQQHVSYFSGDGLVDTFA